MFKKYVLKIYVFFLMVQINFSAGFNISVAPTKVEINLLKNSVEEIYLINNTEKTMKLLSYFETPTEFKNSKFEKIIEVFPKIVTIPPKGEKVVKVLYKINKEIDLNKEHKTYIIFKELPYNLSDEDKNKITIYNEIGIGITGKKY
ncbi:MAG: fimbria/pilus periplasmic chaperone [Cetobacterium sp.]|uniref:fimbria/pilus periplasmic chaperone n=1 Tax=Cetobacterium sp. TaxID=2071632 RepID=UPI003F3E8AD6